MVSMSHKSFEDTIREKAKQCKNTHFMIVDGMTNLLNGKVPECQSSRFNAFGLKWYFNIRSDEDKDNLSFYLLMASDSEEECSFKLGIVPKTGETENIKPFPFKWFKGEDDSWGQAKFVAHEVLRKSYIVDGKAGFYAEITDVKSKSAVTPTMAKAERLKLKEVPKNNSKFTWKITRFSSFTDKSHSSYEFNVEERRWMLEMFPKGKTGKDGHLSLFLTATDYKTSHPKAPVFCNYKLRILDQLKLNHYEKLCGSRFSSESNSWGSAQLVSLEELNNTSRGLLVKDEIYLGVEFLFISTYENL